MTSLFIGLPAYNESLALPNLLKKISILSDLLRDRDISVFVIVNDDGSTDETKEVAESNFIHLEIKGKVLSAAKNEGLGQGIRNIIKYFLNHSTENSYLVLMDADDTHDPIQIIQMLNEGAEADVVIASRFRSGSKIRGVPMFRILTGNLARIYLQILFPRSGVRDFTCGYRLYKRDALLVLQKSNSNFFGHNGFAAMPELLLNLLTQKTSFIEIPLDLKYDNKPTPSSMKVFRNSVQIILLGFQIRLKSIIK